MKLIHYTANAEFKLNQISYLQKSHFKPNGFWFSVEDYVEDDIDWNVWCVSEEFQLENLAHAYIIKLSPKAKILHLKDETDLHRITKFFVCPRAISKTPFVVVNAKSPHYSHFDQIDWQTISQDFDGIIIAPYQWSCRLDPKYFWYYGWDCSSGCIWNLNVIADIKKIEVKNAITTRKS